MNTKTCSTCKETKDESEFSFKNKEKNTRSSRCKTCHTEYVKQHYSDNKKVYKSRARKSLKEHRLNIRQMILEYLSDKSCVDCGNSDPRVLDFDHINPKTKHKDVSKMFDSSWETILKEIRKCEVRCANCHRIRTSEQFQTYRTK